MSAIQRFATVLALVFVLALAARSSGSSADHIGGPWHPVVLVSVGSGAQGDGSSMSPSISDDARFVTFTSLNDDLVPGDNDPTDFPFQASDVFIQDLILGSMEMVNLTNSGQMLPDGLSAQSSRISGNGQFILFTSQGDLTPEPSDAFFPSSTHLYVRDQFNDTTHLVDRRFNGHKSERGPGALGGDISNDGRWVVFLSSDGQLTPGRVQNCMAGPNPSFCTDAYLFDRQTQTMTLISHGFQGEQSEDNASGGPRISDTGDVMVFDSNADNLDEGDQCAGTAGACVDVFAYAPLSDNPTLVSKSTSGEHGNAESYSGDISGDGRYVVFQSEATNLVPNDQPMCPNNENCMDIFRHDLQTRVTELVSSNIQGVQGNGPSQVPSINDDGRYISFYSTATNLVPGADTDCALGQGSVCSNVYVKDMLTGAVSLASTNEDGDGGNYSSFLSSLSDDGQNLVFSSGATDLVPDDNGIACPGANLPYECFDIFLAFARHPYYGDINCDGVIDGRDALELTRYRAETGALAHAWCPLINTQGGIFGTRPLGGISVLWGDMNCDNTVDMRDTISHLLYLARARADDAQTSGECAPIGPDPTPGPNPSTPAATTAAPSGTASTAPTITPTPGNGTPTATPTPTPTTTPITATPTAAPTVGTTTPAPTPSLDPLLKCATFQNPAPIPDNSGTGTTAVFDIQESGAIAQLAICINIDHLRVGDLVVTLTHDSTATTVTLIDRPGAPPGTGCGGDDVRVYLRDAEANPVEDTCGSPIGLNGFYYPNGMLSDFEGEDISGGWTLTVRDMQSQAMGTLLGATLYYDLE